ncbi:MAG: ATP-binding protein [Nitrospirales bacterium]|nr:ATP-binding protein [Nitrospirales bacterium]
MKAQISPSHVNSQETFATPQRFSSSPEAHPTALPPIDSARSVTNPQRGIMVLLCLLVTGIFALDVMTPVGVTDGILYVTAILMTPWLPNKRAPFIVAGVCTVLTIFGVVWSPGINVIYSGSILAWNAFINRIYAIIVLWATAWLSYQYCRKTEHSLRLASIVESSQDAIIGQTLQGRITTWNKGAERIFGYTEQEVLGKFMTILFPPDRFLEEPEILGKLQRGETIVNLETVRRRKDGATFPASITVSPLVDRWGKVVGASKILRDVSKEARMKDLMAVQSLVLARHAADLKQSNEDLEQFAYIASHDLQEPLRTIHGFTQLLESRYRERLDDQGREFIGFVTDAASRMQTLIQDLLKYSRIQSQELKPASVDAEEVVTEILNHLLLTIEEKHATITHDPLPTIRTDPGHFHHLLQNLLTNALKFAGSDPPCIHIAARETDAEWEFSVRDNGIGIAPDFHERIFLPFKRLHHRGEYPGTGIGLAVCKKIVERRGGRIRVESEPGKGSTFSFSLPK